MVYFQLLSYPLTSREAARQVLERMFPECLATSDGCVANEKSPLKNNAVDLSEINGIGVLGCGDSGQV